MSFTSLSFLFFLPIVLVLYHGLARYRRAQNILLLLASYVFYGAWDWRFLSLIWFSTGVDYLCGLAIARDRSHASRFLLTSLATNLGLLFTFKYFGFFQESAIALAANFGCDLDPLSLQIVLPVGISFYTFQTLSYTIDISRGQLEPRRNLLDFALFVAFFPQLVAGPIERARSFLPQIERPRRVSSAQLSEGSWLIGWGYFKKVFIADNVAMLVDEAFAPGFEGGGADYLVAVWAFAVQIYCDFSGYSNIARGIAKLLGFELMVNFALPYFARNPSDFWRRWHISLSTWLRDYLYVSLGGNRVSISRTYRNLFLTMLLGGLWHGAAWTFVIWGAFHGGWLALHRALRPRLPTFPPRAAWVGQLLCIGLTFHGVCLGWLFFRADSLDQALMILGRMARGFQFEPSTWNMLIALMSYATPLIAVQLWQAREGDAWVLRRAPPWVQGAAFGAMFYLVALYGAVSDAFIYFQF